MDLHIEKSRIAIIWLDSSIIIKLAKLKNGRQLNPVDTDRLNRLYDVLSERVHNARLICPIAHQREEYEPKDMAEDCFRMQQELSMGAQFLAAENIQFIQFRQAIEARNQRKRQVNVSYRDAFPCDPVILIKTGRFIPARYVTTPELSIYQMARMKNWGNQELERLRTENVTNGTTFEDQLAVEHTSISQVLRKVEEDWQRLRRQGIPPGPDGIWQFLTVCSQRLNLSVPFAILADLAGGNDNFESFLRSNDFRSVPHVDIGCKLFAYLVTRNTPIRTGDAMDVQQLSVVIPYCDIVLVDNDMKDALGKHDICQKYRCRAYTMRDLATLETYIGQL